MTNYSKYIILHIWLLGIFTLLRIIYKFIHYLAYNAIENVPWHNQWNASSLYNLGCDRWCIALRHEGKKQIKMESKQVETNKLSLRDLLPAFQPWARHITSEKHLQNQHDYSSHQSFREYIYNISHSLW